MKFEATPIPGLVAVRLERLMDERGSFARLFCREEFAAAGLKTEFVQESLSVTKRAGTIRGMHYQTKPHEEAKFVRCVRGSLYDVIVDLRPDSPSYLAWQAFDLSATGDLALYIPEGCAHGFQTLSDEVEILYHMSTKFAPRHGNGFRYDDPLLSIVWPLPPTVIADKDLSWPRLRVHE